MHAVSTRKTADERREDILAVALVEFGEHGLHGTSTDTIAQLAGVSQPYLFRLFGTKKELYLESVRRCLRQTLEVFQEAAAGKSGEDALDAIGKAYGQLLRDRTRLQAQMQAYADCGDEDVREVVRDGYGKLVEFVERVSGAEPERIRDFFAFGMLLNVFASMDLLDRKAPWAKKLLAASLEPKE
ncbi:MAG TPA: TetR/AcrR family transcriptional regulator [Gaiellaceae bacterium]|jgi:AcrR family transcriptional regulator|nr:TetR/AcrR family transcriptional regulator [Gaiellaceae bacterium]